MCATVLNKSSPLEVIKEETMKGVREKASISPTNEPRSVSPRKRASVWMEVLVDTSCLAWDLCQLSQQGAASPGMYFQDDCGGTAAKSPY